MTVLGLAWRPLAPSRRTGRLRTAVLWAIRQPALHFVIIGAAIFGAYTMKNGVEGARGAEIRVGEGELRWLADNWRSQFGRAPTLNELRAEAGRYVEDEMRYREAVALGLDRGDTIVRRRMVQKYDFLAAGQVAAPAPRAGELEAYFARHADRYRSPQAFSFCQAYFGGDAQGLALAQAAAARASANPGAAPPAGQTQRLPVEDCHTGAAAGAVARAFGADFAATLSRLPTGRWVGPVQSGYGYHVVTVSEASPGARKTFAAARPQVEADWRREATGRAAAEQARALRDRYRVQVDDAALVRLSRDVR